MAGQLGIGRQELEVLRFIADNPAVTVTEVSEAVGEPKGLHRNTVLNVMERLRKKSYLTRKKAQGLFRYSSSKPKEELLGSLVDDFVDNALGGSVSPLMEFLTKRAPLSGEQVEELRRLVDGLEDKR
jgi:predicted transcriptional regulator